MKAPETGRPKSRFKVFRWKAIGPLLLLLVLLGFGWVLFGDLLVEDTSEEAAMEFLGTQLDLSGLRIRETEPAVEVARAQLADPFDPNRNLLETGAIGIDLDPAALLEKKFVIDRLVIREVRFGTRRETPASPADPEGFAGSLLRTIGQWRQQFDLPILKLSTLDTVKQLVLDPTKLGTIQEARALVGVADSLRQGLTHDLRELDPRPVLDSAKALVTRLASTSRRELGVAGAARAVQSVRSTIRAVDSLERRVTRLRAEGEAGVERLRGGVASLDAARQRDYDFARSLIQLPRFDAPNVGAALFGPISIDRFEQVVYWSELAERLLPPGLQPRRYKGPKRLRRAGTTVVFPREQEFPQFLLRDGRVDLAFDLGGARQSLVASVGGITTAPALYGRPATVRLGGTVGGANPLTLALTGSIDHTGPLVRDSVVARVSGIRLPEFGLPGLPFRVDPGIGTTGLTFLRRADQITARWTLRTGTAAWQRTAAAADGSASSVIESIIWRVVSELRDLEVSAELRGSLRRPSLSIHSNLDEAIANRLRTLLSDEVARVEARVRAEVDRQVAAVVAEARARFDGYRQQVVGEVVPLQSELERVQGQLEDRLEGLIGSAIPFPRPAGQY